MRHLRILGSTWSLALLAPSWYTERGTWAPIFMGAMDAMRSTRLYKYRSCLLLGTMGRTLGVLAWSSLPDPFSGLRPSDLILPMASPNSKGWVCERVLRATCAHVCLRMCAVRMCAVRACVGAHCSVCMFVCACVCAHAYACMCACA